MTSGTQRLISRSVFYFVLAIGLFIGLVYVLRGVLAPVLLAFLVAYAFNPLVEFLARRRVPRSVASVLCLMLMLLLTAGLLALFVPALQQEIQSVAGRMPGYLEKIRQSAIPWVEETFGIEVPDTLGETLSAAKAKLGGRMEQLAGPVSSVIKTMLSGTLALLASLIYVIIVPLFIFYFLRDYRKITSWFNNLVPLRHREKVLGILGEVDDVLAGFLRGQMIIISTLAVVYSVVLSLLQVPAAITIGITAGLFNIVPYLGTATGLLLSCLFLLLEGAAWTSYLIVAVVFVGVATTDGLFMTPRILGKKLGLAPVMVILAILAFGEVFGFFGVLLAVPVTAVGKVLGNHALKAYRRSRAFRRSDEGAGEDSASEGSGTEA